MPSMTINVFPDKNAMTNQEMMYEKSEELMPKLVELLRQLPGIVSVTVYPEGHVSITSNVHGEGCRSFWHDGEMKFPDRVDFLSEKQMADNLRKLQETTDDRSRKADD